MKKKMTYNIDISLRKSGFVNAVQCECGAGEGTTGHCKHIRTVVFACCKFINLSNIKMESSCTEKLQSFHKAKKLKKKTYENTTESKEFESCWC